MRRIEDLALERAEILSRNDEFNRQMKEALSKEVQQGEPNKEVTDTVPSVHSAAASREHSPATSGLPDLESIPSNGPGTPDGLPTPPLAEDDEKAAAFYK